MVSRINHFARHFYLQLLGVIAVTIDGPNTDKPHQHNADSRHHRQQWAHIAHHRQRDGTDYPVGTQAVIQLDFWVAAICQFENRLKMSPGARLSKKLSE